jgi:hypothetical protein
MEQLLESLINLLGENMPELSFIDEDYGQLEMINQENRDTYPLTFPAVLIDAPDVIWSNIAGLSQKGTCTIRAKLIIDCYDDTHHGSGTTELIAERAALRAKLHRLLQGYRIEGMTELIRTSSRFYTWDHGIKVYEQTYTGIVTELLEPQTESVAATPKITFGGILV